MSESTQTPNAEASQEVNQQDGSDDAAVAALLKNSAKDELGEEPKDDEPEPASDAAEDADTEAEEADPDAEPDAEELVEVEIGGKTFEVAAAVQKAILRQADYSRKMNEVSAVEKTLNQRMELVETLERSAEKRGEALAEVKLIDARIKTYDGIDWAKLQTENPGQAAMAAVQLMTLKDQRKDAVQAAANVARELTDGNNELLASARDEMDATLKKNLKGWGDELGVKLTKYAQDNGVQLKTLKTLTDPAVVIALDKAQKWDALQANKTAIKGKAQPAPQVSKPGSARKTNARSDAMTRLRQDNSEASAVAAFLAR